MKAYDIRMSVRGIMWKSTLTKKSSASFTVVSTQDNLSSAGTSQRK
jgi:hypothetical protein